MESNNDNELKRQVFDFLGDSLEAENEEVEKLKGQLQRTLADFENHKRRTGRDQEERANDRLREFIIELSPVIDALDSAIANMQYTTVTEGLLTARGQLEKILSKFGVEAIPTVGKMFDPNVHEAVQVKVANTFPPGVVTDVVTSGYTMNGKVIKAAQVVVSK